MPVPQRGYGFFVDPAAWNELVNAINANTTTIAALPATNITGTIPDARLSSNIPLKSAQNSFAAVQTIAGTSIDIGGISLQISDAAVGGIFGPTLAIGRNTAGICGTLSLMRSNGSNFAYIWPDNTYPNAIWRSGTPPTTSSGPTGSGEVIGAQTSTLDQKHILGDGPKPEDALATLLRTPIVRFMYKDRRYCETIFNGIVTDWSPEFGMDPSDEHPCGRSFSAVSAFGYTVQAIKALEARIAVLEQALGAV